jgi:uncharacterized membrane protein
MHHQTNGHHADAKDAVARGLGWFSLGLGVAQIAAPRGVARLIGLRADGTHAAVMRAVGVREVAAGVGILARRRPAGWLWSRVAGDVMDLALLAAADTRRRPRVAAAMAAVAGVTVPDLLESLRLSRNVSPAEETEDGLHVRAAVTIRRPRQEVYSFWQDFENFPSFMDHVEAVETTGEGRSHWTVKAPGGRTVEWDAETVESRPNELISWRSLPGAKVENSGTVRFADATLDRGTEVHVDLRYDPPTGGLGAVVAKFFGEEPQQQVKDDLRRLKQFLETGDIPVSEGNPDGHTARRLKKQEPASPRALEGAVA